MLAHLKSGSTATVTELIHRFARHQAQAEFITHILSWLSGCRVFVTGDESSNFLNDLRTPSSILPYDGSPAPSGDHIINK